MIDLQIAADGVGKLRVRHIGGSEGILASIQFGDNSPLWRGPVLTLALDDGGRLEAPQASVEIVP